jgi:hypothetical protein
MQRSLLRSVVLFTVGAVVFLSSAPARAWIDTGHKIVALIAWDELTPKAKAAITATLKQHPRYDKDLAAFAPDGASGEALDRHVFAVAATWPDLVRSQNNPMHTLYNHPAWHYIDIPFIVDGSPAPADNGGDNPGPHNIVEALQKNTADLKSDTVPASEKAVSICWILHLVGDIHQPLHAASMISKDFPDGDRGGNSLTVLRDPPYGNTRTNLHLLWDELPGQYKSETFEGYVAAGVRADPRYSRDNLKDQLAVTDFMAWAKESHDLAVQYAYLNGKLQYISTEEASKIPQSGPRDGGQRESIPGVPPGYIAKAEEVVASQLALAGHRLADLLNATLDPK